MPNTLGYHVPVMVAVTTALASGGAQFDADSPPPNAVPLDLPTDKLPQTIAPAGSHVVTWPAMGATEFGLVTALGISSDDLVNTRITTRIDGVAVPPLIASFGAVGTMDDPTILSVPIRLGPGQVFSLLMENVGAANILMAARTLGWRSNT
jgi:hypothetical protein